MVYGLLGLLFFYFFSPLKPKPEICSELRKSSMSLGIGLLLNCSVCVCACVRATSRPKMPRGLSLTVGVLKRVRSSWLASLRHGWGESSGGARSPPPPAPRSLSSTSVQACSLLALSFPICYRHFWPGWVLSALSRRPLVQEISPTHSAAEMVCVQQRGEKKGSARGRRKACVCGGGNISPDILIGEKVYLLQENNAQLWLLTCSVARQNEGGILEGLAAVSVLHAGCISS